MYHFIFGKNEVEFAERPIIGNFLNGCRYKGHCKFVKNSVSTAAARIVSEHFIGIHPTGNPQMPRAAAQETFGFAPNHSPGRDFRLPLRGRNCRLPQNIAAFSIAIPSRNDNSAVGELRKRCVKRPVSSRLGSRVLHRPLNARAAENSGIRGC